MSCMKLFYVYLFIHLQSIDARFIGVICFFYSSEAQTLLKKYWTYLPLSSILTLLSCFYFCFDYSCSYLYLVKVMVHSVIFANFLKFSTFNSRNTRKMCDIFSKSTTKTEQCR